MPSEPSDIQALIAQKAEAEAYARSLLDDRDLRVLVAENQQAIAEALSTVYGRDFRKSVSTVAEAMASVGRQAKRDIDSFATAVRPLIRDFARGVREAHSAVTFVAERIQPELAETLRIIEGFRPVAIDLVATLEKIRGGAELQSQDVAASVSQINEWIGKLATDLPPASDTQGATLRSQLARIHDSVERELVEVRADEDEAGRRERLGKVLRGAIAGTTGLETDLATPEKRAKLIFQILRTFFSLLLGVLLTSPDTADSEFVKRRQIEQDRALTVIAETVRRLETEVRQLNTRTVDLRVCKTAVLRVGPSSASAKAGRLSVGTTLHLVTSFGRWYYVEILDRNGSGTDETGWVYRRNVEHLEKRRPNP